MRQLVQASSRAVKRQKLLVYGENPFTAPVNQPSVHDIQFQSDWLESVAPSTGPVRITNIAAGYGHTLLSYHSLKERCDRVFAIGRNEAGQCGLEYNAHEPTRGNMQGFEGTAVVGLAASVQGSFVLVKQHGQTCAAYCFALVFYTSRCRIDDTNAVFACGSLMRGVQDYANFRRIS